MNVFAQQAQFMQACDQTVGVYNRRQMALYEDLIAEELQELHEAEDSIDRLDALVDILVVTIGRALSEFSVDVVEQAWLEVLRSNLAKVGPDGKVVKREDGKVLKPDGWTAPDLSGVLSGHVRQPVV